MSLQSRLKSYANLIDNRLEALLPPVSDEPAILHEAIRYSALAPGKRLRPALVLAASETVGGDLSATMNAACAVELIHCFSLIHDDLPSLDNDDLRRGRPTCHVQFGEAVAILAGDALFALAFEVLAQSDVSPKRIVRAILMLTRATSLLVNGETIDIMSEGKNIHPETLRLIHERKTGALITASCELGALIGGGTEEQIAALGQYGRKIGLAFQIADDLLNETSTPEQLGKAAGSDRARGKATYPGIHGVESAREAAKRACEEGIAALGPINERELLVAIAKYSIERLN